MEAGMDFIHRKATPFFVIILTACISLTACGSTTVSSQSSELTASENTTSMITGLAGKYMQDWSNCVPGMQAGTVTCVVGYTVKNPTNAPIELSYTQVYAVVDGKIFKASTDQGSDGVGALTQNWNPGEELKSGTYFDIPKGSTLQKIFFASEPSLASAEMILEINLKGIAS